MLVVKRKRGEAVWIGQTRVVVESLGNGKVRLAIDAPAGMQIMREELLTQKAGPKEQQVEEKT